VRLRFDDRALALAVMVGALMASMVFTVSIIINAPRVWPGTSASFLIAGSQTYLFATRRKP
jgi:hypothetical protein